MGLTLAQFQAAVCREAHLPAVGHQAVRVQFTGVEVAGLAAATAGFELQNTLFQSGKAVQFAAAILKLEKQALAKGE